MQAFYLLASAITLFGLSLTQTSGHRADAFNERTPLFQDSERRGLDDSSKAALDCLPTSEIPVEGLNLTARDQDLLSQLCWPRGYREELKVPSLAYKGRGIPEGVQCNFTTWCDDTGRCSEVCERGSVVIDPWLTQAIHTQLQLARRVPLCFTTLLGTHNSAITIADGYGNLDLYFQQYLQLIPGLAKDLVLRTNDQWFSLTDQLNMGVRAIELDTHEVEGALRIAHCGGLHSALDTLIQAVNLVAKLLHHPIHWDTETIGCNPSLSSIAVTDQRTFVDALQEISAWLALPANSHEFVVLYLDDQLDLLPWGKVPQLLTDILSVFPVDIIYTPVEHTLRPEGPWPSIDDLVGLGRRVLFVSGVDYGVAMQSLIFPRRGGSLCEWREPPLEFFQPEPDCAAVFPLRPQPVPTLGGTLLRITSCELQYGPFNCDFVWRPDNGVLLDETNIPAVARCGLNMPSPDLLTPARAAAHVWTWAAGHPRQALIQGWKPWWVPLRLQPLWGWLLGSPEEAHCAVISESDGRWRAMDCSAALPTACRSPDANWMLMPGQRGNCPDGFSFEVPHTAKENLMLQAVLHVSPLGVSSAWLPITGPDWDIKWGVLSTPFTRDTSTSTS